MNKSNFFKLIQKKLLGDLSKEEQQQLDTWKQASNENASLADDMERIWQASTNYPTSYQPDVEGGLSRLQARIEHASTPTKVVSIGRRKWLLRSAAAVLLLIGMVGVWQYLSALQPALQVASTVIGETKTLTLADGSTITLNEASTLRYPESFDATHRKVELEGEAFFDIARKEEQPFQITTDYAKITVLGTSFNVREMAAESTTEVAVATGKVRVEPSNQSNKLTLTKGEKGVYNRRSQVLRKVEHPTSNATSWMSQQLHFKKTPLRMVLRDLERHFKVSIELENLTLEDCTVTSLYNAPELKKILPVLAGSFELDLEQTAPDAYVLKNGRCH